MCVEEGRRRGEDRNDEGGIEGKGRRHKRGRGEEGMRHRQEGRGRREKRNKLSTKKAHLRKK